MRYLLDVNVLLAWGWADHTEHRRAALWISAMKAKSSVTLLTSAIPELGFVRVSVQRTFGRLAVAEASGTLHGMLKSLGKRHLFLPDTLSSTAHLPAWCKGASQSTDAHLLTLATIHDARLATLNAGIPGAFLVPIE